MNEELNNLKNSGWILTESALKSIEANSNTKKNLVKTLLDRDLREIGAGINDLHKGKIENVEHDLVVLQILKLRNISSPKANENSKTAPRLLKIQLTDGQNTYSAIEMEPTALSLETRPGTKISLKVKQLKFANGQLLLTPKNMEILGGYVEALVSKWEISRSLANQMKGNRSNAAPPFIPFGQKIQQNLPNDKGFKSLQQHKTKEGEENSEFNAQRQDAIAEASKASTRKTFAVPNKTLVDSNVQKIMDKGYTEEQATTALKYVNNNVEKALINLKKREERQAQRAGSNDYNNTRENSRDVRKGGKNATSGSSGTDPPPAKPSSGVSLFDFLENKIPETTAKSQSSSSQAAYNERFENNISSSFRKHDKDNSNKSQWSQYSSSNEHKSSQNYNQKGSYNARNDYRNNNNEGGSDRREQYKGDYGNNRKYERDSRDGPKDSSRYHQQQQSSNYSSKPNAASNSNSYSKSSPISHSQSMSQKPNSYNSSNSNGGGASNYNNNNQGSRYEKGKYGQQQKSDYNSRGSAPSQREYNSYSKDYSTNSSGANNNNTNNFNSKYDSKYDKPQRSNSDIYQKQERKIVESMEKMSLKGNHQSQPSSYQKGGYDSHDVKSNSYQQQQSSTSSESKQQGYAKNQTNYPIVGFQNKEANEQAKNALKTKNIPGAPKWQQPQQQQTTVQAVPIQMVSQAHAKGPPAPFATTTNAPPPMHSLQPQPFVQHPVMHPIPAIAAQPTAVIATANPPPAAVFHAAPIPYQTPIIMQSVQAPPIVASPAAPAGIQQLKVGDLCLAKYWEDGKFYNAKITGISESTYVVLFTDYGNAEEVRKNDCVPLIMPTCPTPPQPVTNFVQPPQMGSYRISSQQKMPPQQHSYHSQPQSMPYKAGGKNPRRN